MSVNLLASCVQAFREAQADNPGSFSDETWVNRILSVIWTERELVGADVALAPCREAIPQSNARPIDLSKIRPGDEIEVRHKVFVIGVDGSLIVEAKNQYHGVILVSFKNDAVTRHIPTAQPIKVGDRVRSDNLPCCNPHKVMAIVDGSAWVKSGDHSQAIVSVSGLTRIDQSDRSVSL